MSCEATREFLLHSDWDAEGRAGAMKFLRHLEACAACQAAVADFDELRRVLSPVQAPQPAGGWDAMERRLIDRLPQPRRLWFPRALALAASVVVAFALFELGRRTATAPASVAPLALGEERVVAAVDSGMRRVSPGELSHDVRAFREVSDVYEGHAGWMMVSPETSDVGLISERASPGKKVLMLRLSLCQGREVVSNADLVVVAGQKADLTLPLPHGRLLRYRIGTGADEPTRLTVRLELRTPNGSEPLAVLATNLQMRPGQELSAGKFMTTAGEYELKIDFAGGEFVRDY